MNREINQEINQEMIDLSYEWWTKLTPLWKKFARETRLCGYDMEDLTQECYLQLVKCLERFDEALGVPFESYYKIQLYGWRANQNRKKSEMLSINEEVYQQILEKPDTEPAIENQIENKVLFEQICREIAHMKDMDQAIVTQYYIQNKPLKEVAENLDIKYKAAEFRKGKIIRRLQEALENCPPMGVYKML